MESRSLRAVGADWGRWEIAEGRWGLAAAVRGGLEPLEPRAVGAGPGSGQVCAQDKRGQKVGAEQ